MTKERLLPILGADRFVCVTHALGMGSKQGASRAGVANIFALSSKTIERLVFAAQHLREFVVERSSSSVS